MRNDERFEIERALDLLPHVIGASWAAVWFRLSGIKKPTKAQFRERVAYYMGTISPLFEVYGDAEPFSGMSSYIRERKDAEIKKILAGKNPEIEKRYDRYVDYG